MSAGSPFERRCQRLAERCLSLSHRGLHAAARRLWQGLAELGVDRLGLTLLEGMMAFASGRYRDAERCYWRVLEAAPGHLEARAFLAEALILQRRTGEARRVLDGLGRARGPHPALAFADSLRSGLELGVHPHLSRLR